MKITAGKMVYELNDAGALGMRVRLEQSMLAAPAQKTELDFPSNFQPQSMEELVPRDEDYIYPVYRALSQCVIECYYTDHTRPGVLEASVPLLQKQTVYTDHFTRAENWVGVVESAWWDIPAESGTKFVTPGINVKLKIDAKVNPKIARGILMDPPALHSVSVGIWFNWEKSHPNMPDRTFWERLGQEVDGHRVLIVVTEILSYDEISLVFQGADPEAKKFSAAEPATLSNSNEEETHSSQFTASPAGEGKFNTISGGEQMEEKLKQLMALLKAASPEGALDAAIQKHEALAKAEQYLPLAIELQDTQMKPGQLKEVIAAGQAYRTRLQDDLKKFAALAMCDADQTLPEGFVESQMDLSVAQLEKNVAVYRGMAEKKYPGRSSLASVPEVDTAAQKPLVDTSRLHGK